MKICSGNGDFSRPIDFEDLQAEGYKNGYILKEYCAILLLIIVFD